MKVIFCNCELEPVLAYIWIYSLLHAIPPGTGGRQVLSVSAPFSSCCLRASSVPSPFRHT